MNKLWLVPLLALSLLAISGSGEAQIRNCGEIQIIFLNPDLQPANDGKIHASGDFFAQFQAIGAAASEIETFGFSFGHGASNLGDDVCDLPSQAWFTGQPLVNYRADVNEEDGFFINLQTPLVPDGEYSAAVHAYDASDNELARFWAPAVVDNCDTATAPGVERCTDDEAQQLRMDTTAPWPIMLPGDGITPSDASLSIEFAEPVENLAVSLNGEDITAELESWEGRLWDNDYFPGYGPAGLGGLVAPECSQEPPQDCTTLGEAYKWNGRSLTDDDVWRVEATDLNGNAVSKDIHVGSGVTGGAISDDIPILTWQVAETNLETTPGSFALFQFTMSNQGGETGHPFVEAEGPPGFEFEWNPAHKPVPAGESSEQELTVTVPGVIAEGTYEVNATLEYNQQGAINELPYKLFVTIANGSSEEEIAALNEPEAEESPGAPLVFAVIALAAIAARLRKS